MIEENDYKVPPSSHGIRFFSCKTPPMSSVKQLFGEPLLILPKDLSDLPWLFCCNSKNISALGISYLECEDEFHTLTNRKIPVNSRSQ